MRKRGESREYLKELRKAKGLSLRQIAPKLDISFSYYSDIENGNRNPSIELAMRMADFFKIDLAILLTDRVKFNEESVG